MARVFISYAREDLAGAREIYRWLDEAGHDVFLDQDPREGIAVGEQWEQRLYERLHWADAMVCVVTTAYLTSIWCTAEVSIARSRGGRLLPVRAEPGVAHPLLNSTQYTDLTRDPAHARAALVEALRSVKPTWPDDRSPFPGLRPFDADRHQVFFGRAEEFRQLAGMLHAPGLRAALLVVGPSGCGKSSLVRAGLVPVVAKEPGWWTLPPIMPGDDPVGALARELAAACRQCGLDRPVAHVRDQLEHRELTGLAEELLVAAPEGPRRRLLVVVDQFEELLTQTSPDQRARFVDLLRPALTGPVQVVGTLRPEFLDQLLLDPHLAALPTQSFMLRPLRREALRAAIEKPAGLAGINIDDGLTDRLIDDTDSGEALPLLAFTLAQLAEGIGRGGRLSAARYDLLGGVQGALTHQADAALADAVSIGGRNNDQVIAGLLRLVTVDEHGRPTRWRIPRDELPRHLIAELNTFVARRLLITDTDNGTVTIGVAHEAFLSAWPPLADAITANVSALRARRAIEHAATHWDDNGRPRERLWGGGQLAAAVSDLKARISTDRTAPGEHSARRPLRRRGALVTRGVGLGPTAREFLLTSIRRDRLRRRRATIVLSVLLVLALISAGVALIQRQAAQEQRRIATARQLIAQADATQDTDPLTALQLAIAAQRIHPGSETHASLVNLLLLITPYAGTIAGHTSSVNSVAFSPDRRTLATAGDDRTVRLWDVRDRTVPRPLGRLLPGHSGWVNSVAFSPDGRTLASAGSDHTVRLWDVSDRAAPRPLGRPLTDHTDAVLSVAFSPDGRTLATTGSDRTVRLWDVSDPAAPRPLGRPLTTP